MKKTVSVKMIAFSLVTSALLFTGCGDDTSKAKVIENKPAVEKEVKADAPVEAKAVYTKYDAVVNEVFKDTAKIGPNDKFMLVVFGTNTDPYTDRLKADIKASKELSQKIQNDFSSYYLKAHENLRHKLYHEGEFMDVDTKTMIAIYGIESTPTLIFTDKNGKAVIVVPGYMPTEQFISTLKFMESGKWKGKDRKNGDVYEALRDFYIADGIEVKKAK